MYSKLGSIVFFVVGEGIFYVPQGKATPRTNLTFAPRLTDSFAPGGGGYPWQGRAACWSVALLRSKGCDVPTRILCALSGCWLAGFMA